MRVVFDALGAPERSGGMRLHATQVMSTWSAQFDGDSLHMVAPRWAGADESLSNIHLHRWTNESILTRAPGQLFRTAAIAHRVKADIVISLSPIVTPLTACPRIAFQHDWRHLKNPGEFGVAQRVYRAMWRYSARWADANACISQKTVDETLHVAPRARASLIPNGFDEARTWKSAASTQVPGQIVTFGHHNNKRPELMIRALAEMLPAGEFQLIVLGATGDYRTSLSRLAHDLGVEGHVTLPGFISKEDYEATVSSSSLIALVSSDEGFGLPIAEAEALRIPALIASDSGVADIFGGYPTVADPAPEALAAAAIEAMRSPVQRPPSSGQTWARTVAQLRALAQSVIDEQAPDGART